jgi:hypothetical protein
MAVGTTAWAIVYILGRTSSPPLVTIVLPSAALAALFTALSSVLRAVAAILRVRNANPAIQSDGHPSHLFAGRQLSCPVEGSAQTPSGGAVDTLESG